MRWFTWAFFAVTAYAAYELHYVYTTPETVRAFYAYRAELEQAARSVSDDGIDVENAKRKLAQTGFTSVREEGGCTIFYFTTFMAGIDSWHEIVYSPEGHRYLPDYRRGKFNRLYELRNVDDAGQWFYVIHD